MAGMRTAQLADMAPSKKNTATTGTRPARPLSPLVTGAFSDRQDLDTATPQRSGRLGRDRTVGHEHVEFRHSADHGGR